MERAEATPRLSSDKSASAESGSDSSLADVRSEKHQPESGDAQKLQQTRSYRANPSYDIDHFTPSTAGYKLGVSWTGLTVQGVNASTNVNENFLSQFNILQKIKEGRKPPPYKTILDNSHGTVKPGEMLLVLGRPGAGCTTLLNILANQRADYASVEGDVHYGSMDHKEAKKYPGQIVMSSEEEIFFPTLTVEQTMDFATRMKIAEGQTEEQRTKQREAILTSLGVGHTLSTKIGNEFVRGVSGGERRRISLAETFAARASVVCWDNSTRGLDASTALEYIQLLRVLTDSLGLSTIVTLYQAGNGIYKLFDKVLLLDRGKQLYYGPREEALPFMQNLGFYCDPSANVADYLTGVTVPSEREVLEGYENSFPHSPEDFTNAYAQSDVKKRMEKELEFPTSAAAKEYTEEFKSHVRSEQARSLPKFSSLTSGPIVQIKGNIIRQVQVLWGDKPTLAIKQVTTIINALLTGSLFYKASNDSTGLFLKGGAIFLSVLFPTLLAMSETTDSFVARPILAKHRMYSFHAAAAFCFGQIIADLPILFLMVTPFSLIIYFMVGLTMSAVAYFTYWFMLFSISVTMTAFFRLCGAAFPNFQAASKVSGFAVSAVATYVGYQIPKPEMHPWFVWIYWINPLSYAFESLLSSEFHGKDIPCAGYNLVPLGPSYSDLTYASCTGIRGAEPGATSVPGDRYLASLSYSSTHIWRNFGVVWAWWALFVGLTVFFTNRWSQSSGTARSLLVPREKTKSGPVSTKSDEEAGKSDQTTEQPQRLTATTTERDLLRNTSIFTWKNLSYTVSTPGGERTLLDNVHGWVKPGQLGALMGSSGAGKTTLMDVLAQRKTAGTIHGSVLVDGRPLSVSFQRSAGYCEQLDVHERMATVRESLEFAALLRQSRNTPREEKLRYVDTIIELLELRDLENTLVGTTGNGLSIEQRKRLTIAIELVSKPEILIFLDEPTSGLDGQAAFSTVLFLRKLADVGQAVLATIHQPSAALFAQFDTLLLLQSGGRMAYFGEIGQNADTLKEYFARYGAPCPEEANPAEHMIEVVSGSMSKDQDWHEVYKSSPEYEKSIAELDRMVAEAAAKPPSSREDGHEFAAPIQEQIRILTRRMNIALYRDTEYVNNRVFLHIGSGLFNGFTFWNIGNSVGDLQLRLFAIFNFIFVAPGVFAQLQPLFLERRDIYETREKKSKTYHWSAFVTALIISEIPYLLLCGFLYWACFYYTVGFPSESSRAGSTLVIMLVYELLYTGIGQFVAAYAPNAVFAALINPLVISSLVGFCGVLVPYQAITAFWRYWMYYLNPFTFVMGGMLTFSTYGVKVSCSEKELAIFDPPSGQSCAAYLKDYISGFGSSSNLLNPDAMNGCRVCQYTSGTDYLTTLNLPQYYYGWRNVGISVVFVFSSYALVYLLMKLRTKATKKAED